jgi:hypothetical protein
MKREELDTERGSVRSQILGKFALKDTMFLSQDRLGSAETSVSFTSGNDVTAESNCLFFHITEKTSADVISLFHAC